MSDDSSPDDNEATNESPASGQSPSVDSQSTPNTDTDTDTDATDSTTDTMSNTTSDSAEHDESLTTTDEQTPDTDQSASLQDQLDSVNDDELQGQFTTAIEEAEELNKHIDVLTVDVPDDLDEEAFFTSENGTPTVVSRYDLEKTVSAEKKRHFEEIDRYWVNEPYAFVVIYRSSRENEVKYYMVEPYLNPIEQELREYLVDKIQSSIKYAGEDSVSIEGDEVDRANVIERETLEHITNYGIRETISDPDNGGGRLSKLLGRDNSNDETLPDTTESGSDGADADADSGGLTSKLTGALSRSDDTDDEVVEEQEESAYEQTNIYMTSDELPKLYGNSVRPEPVVVEENKRTLSEYQIRKILYYLKRNFVGFSKIDGIKHDINVEDISVDGYNSPVFVYHGDYEQIISNIFHGEQELDDFVVKLAQRSGKGISKRQPQVDCTLPDGSRAQLTLGAEVSDHGTNYTIRQFKDVPFTPLDLINWNTFSLHEMGFLWLCIENHKSLIFAGGTASGKTTSLNAVSLFIPSSAKIVSIEDTREVELPQRNWIASVTRPSFSEGAAGDIDEFDLLEAALRQRPDYIVMGEIRGEEGRTLFQVMSTGHTTYTTFHADSVGEVLKRFTTDPINVSKTMFTALDLVSIQTQTRVQGRKVRRNKSLTEINDYNPENDEINVQDVYQWHAESDEFQYDEGASILETIKFDRGWDTKKLQEELFVRRVVLAYLIKNGLNTYTQVAASFQAFMNDPETIMALIARDELETALEDLRQMESVEIDIDPEKEAMVPRPTPGKEIEEELDDILAEASNRIFPEYQHKPVDGLEGALDTVEAEDPVPIESTDNTEDEDAENTPESDNTEPDTEQPDESTPSEQDETPATPSDTAQPDDADDGWFANTQ